MASAASAQSTTIPVRSGEHAAFTRLTLQIPEANLWRFETENRIGRLHVTGPDLIFDISQSFARIPRTRLRSMSVAPNLLTLELGCNCTISAREDIPQYLVIDILGDDTVPDPAPTVSIRPRQRPADLATPSPFPLSSFGAAGIELAQSIKAQAPAQRHQSLLISRLFVAEAPVLMLPEMDEVAQKSPEILNILGRVISDAVGQGVLDSHGSFPMPSATMAETIKPAQHPSGSTELSAHINIATPDDHKKDRTDALLHLPLCESRDIFEGAFSQGPPPDLRSTQIPKQIFSETGVLQNEALAEHIKQYLFLGFGAEARMLMKLNPQASDHAAVLVALSYMVDLEEIPTEIVLPDLTACGAMGAFWVFFASDIAAIGEDFPINHVVHAVNALPAHLRLHLAPAILEKLIQAGHKDAALIVREALDRVPLTATQSLALARARQDLRTAPQDRAAILEQDLSPEMSHAALIFMLERREQLAAPVEPALRETAVSQQFLLRGTDDGTRLAALIARAKARAHDFEKALAFIDARETKLDEKTQRRLRLEVLDKLTQKGADTDFVVTIFAQAPWTWDALPAAWANLAADRLDQLGFELQAQLLRETPHALDDQMLDGPNTPAAFHNGEALAPVMDPINSIEELTVQRASLPDLSSGAADMLRPADQELMQRARAAQLAHAASEPARDTHARSIEPTAHDPRAAQIDEAAHDSAAAGIATPPAPEQARTAPEDIQAVPASVARETQATGLLQFGRETLAQSAELRSRLQNLVFED